MRFENSIDFAKKLDRQDPLKDFRNRFFIPKKNGREVIYLCGNSLGLQPKTASKFIQQELDDWARLAVDGHFHARNPWYYYHHLFSRPLAKIVGAKPEEVAAMNTLTTNLHLMMVSFYRPSPQRYKIIIESPAFPSDRYAVQSQVRYHAMRSGMEHLHPANAIVELKPTMGKYTLRTEDIIETIRKHGKETALVLVAGVNYYTGQAYDMKAIAGAAHEQDACAGFDLAHAAGNIPLKLHAWNADFAVWCSYKYLNSGPGGPGGVFVHEKHGMNKYLPRFAGWWGTDEKERFTMPDEFSPQEGAAGWQLSNAQVLPLAAHKASLDIFEDAGMSRLRKKSLLLTGYLEFLINNINAKKGRVVYRIITPSDQGSRGCQLSIVAGENGKKIFNKLVKKGVAADWRKPDVIRVAPVPLYNRFEEVHRFARMLEELA